MGDSDIYRGAHHEEEGVLMKRFFFIALLFMCLTSEGANHYIRSLSTGTGNNTGVDWNNPITNWTGVSGQWIRGDTYYFAGGDYRPSRTGTGDWRLDAADSGATLTTVYLYSTKANHGTDTGWQDAWTNDIITTFEITIDTDNWHLSGQVGQFATNDVDYVPFHWLNHDTNNPTGDLADFFLNTDVTNITVEHLYIFDDNLKTSQTPPWIEGYVAYYERGNPRFVTNNYVTIDYVAATCLQQGADFSRDTNCVFARNGIGQIAMGYSSVEHSEPVSVGSHLGCQQTDILNCRWQDARSSAWLFCNLAWSNGVVGGCTFRTTGFWNVGVEVSSTTALFSGNDPGHFTDFLTIEQNSFVNIPYAQAFGDSAAFGVNNVAKNNIFYNVTNAIDGTKFAYANVSHHHNYYGLSGTFSETGEQDLNTNPFTHTNSPNTDLSLTFDTTASDNTGFPLYFTDIKGNTYTTSRGAIQFTGAPPPAIGTLLPLNVRTFGR